MVPHTDSGAFTILWQDANGGLEVQAKTGEWPGAPPVEDSFVANIGNILQYRSNGRHASTPHRVVNRYGVDRCSIPYFADPGAGKVLASSRGFRTASNNSAPPGGFAIVGLIQVRAKAANFFRFAKYAHG